MTVPADDQMTVHTFRQLLALRERGVCTEAHRGPQGPNEDISQCGTCWSPTYSMRPKGETFGLHLDDCSLPADHESYCKPGGNGHEPAAKIRG